MGARVKERPILFSGEEVRSTLNGARTQVRRQIRERDVYQDEDGRWIVRFHGARVGLVAGSKDCDELANIDSPYGSRRDRLWVRETHGSADRYYQGHENDVPSVIAYRADQSAIQFDARQPVAVPARDTISWNWDAMKWSPSTFMPRWASRITLPIAEVRIERVQSITEADARAEGVAPAWLDENGVDVNHGAPPTFRQGFVRTWAEVYGREAWEANPWVWVIRWEKAEVRSRHSSDRPIRKADGTRPATLTEAEMAAELRAAGWEQHGGEDQHLWWHGETERLTSAENAYAAMRAAKGAK